MTTSKRILVIKANSISTPLAAMLELSAVQNGYEVVKLKNEEL